MNTDSSNKLQPQFIDTFIREVYHDGSHRVASFSVLLTGTANSAYIHPREIFQRATGIHVNG